MKLNPYNFWFQRRKTGYSRVHSTYGSHLVHIHIVRVIVGRKKHVYVPSFPFACVNSDPHGVRSTMLVEGLTLRNTASYYCLSHFFLYSIVFYKCVLGKEGSSWCLVTCCADYVFTRLFMKYRAALLLGISKQPESDLTHWKPISWLNHACHSKWWDHMRGNNRKFGQHVLT